MKLIITALAAVLALSSCKNATDTGPAFKASVKDLSDSTEVYLGKLGENSNQISLDTTYVMDESFEFNLPDEKFSTLNVISFEGLKQNVLFINNNKDIKATVYKDSLRKSDIDGGKENELFQNYIEHLYDNQMEMKELRSQYSPSELKKDKSKMAEAREKQQKIREKDIEFRKKMIEENPGKLVSALVLSDMVRINMVPNKEVKELFGSLNDEVQRSASAQEIQKTINRSNATEVGAKAPSFSAKTPEGDELSLKESLGKYTILDFWASWCKPCRKANPHMVKIYEKYHSKGLNILSVSLDKKSQKNRWLDAIESDNMTWQHVSNLQFWKGPIVKKYNVKSIPATFILDEDGKIVAKSLRGSSLDDKLEELFGE